jgi:hypothetical protein
MYVSPTKGSWWTKEPGNPEQRTRANQRFARFLVFIRTVATRAQLSPKSPACLTIYTDGTTDDARVV